ncbi:hypothetical protein C8E87_1357 [Paractinoplanes brasiliensis]|uniref:Uncharacterized protein n=1 Tax=Paractinoplanes brasiliensis TaxID=52695 RepID=A0A4R6JMV7_9ACTN|nr:hypothetical protein C8E87_1357 [Actinoplanes brasiliensis]
MFERFEPSGASHVRADTGAVFRGVAPTVRHPRSAAREVPGIRGSGAFRQGRTVVRCPRPPGGGRRTRRQVRPGVVWGSFTPGRSLPPRRGGCSSSAAPRFDPARRMRDTRGETHGEPHGAQPSTGSRPGPRRPAPGPAGSGFCALGPGFCRSGPGFCALGSAGHSADRFGHCAFVRVRHALCASRDPRRDAYRRFGPRPGLRGSGVALGFRWPGGHAHGSHRPGCLRRRAGILGRRRPAGALRFDHGSPGGFRVGRAPPGASTSGTPTGCAPACCAVPGCVVSGCVVSGCVVSGCVVSGCVVPGCVVPGCAVSGCVVPGCAVPGCAVTSFAFPAGRGSSGRERLGGFREGFRGGGFPAGFVRCGCFRHDRARVGACADGGGPG